MVQSTVDLLQQRYLAAVSSEVEDLLCVKIFDFWSKAAKLLRYTSEMAIQM